MNQNMHTPKASPDIWSLVDRIAQSETYSKTLAARQNDTHPSAEMLYDYIFNQLDHEDADKVRTHLAYCPDCADDAANILRLEALDDEDEEDEELIRAEPDIPAQLDAMQPALEFWEPDYAGQELVSSAMKVETYEFQKQPIVLSAYWEGESERKAAHIWISWEVDVPDKAYNLHLQFLNSDTGAILYEVNLGQTRKDDEVFKADELGFDPTNTHFKIAAYTEVLS